MLFPLWRIKWPKASQAIRHPLDLKTHHGLVIDDYYL
jgi:hypothetical protein